MEPENVVAPIAESPAAPAAESAPAVTIADLPEHLIPSEDQYTLESAILAGYSADELAALDQQFGDKPDDQSAEVPAVGAAQSPQTGTVPPGSAVPEPAQKPAAPDPAMAGVLQIIERQNALIASLEAKLNPPAAPPKPEPTAIEKLLAKPIDQLDEVEKFQREVFLTAKQLASEETKELREFAEQQKVAKAQAAQAERQRALANQIYSAAEAQVHHISGNIHANQLTPEDRAAYTNLILATQAAHDNMSAQQAALEARKVLDGAINARMRTPAVPRQPGSIQRPAAPPHPVGGQSASGGASWMPTREQIFKHYGTTPAQIAEGSAEGWKRIPRS